MMTIDKAILNAIKTFSNTGVELCKVLTGYFIDGKNSQITERLQDGDTFAYQGVVNRDAELGILLKDCKTLEGIVEQSKGEVKIEDDIFKIIHISERPYKSALTSVKGEDLDIAFKCFARCQEKELSENDDSQSYYDRIKKVATILGIRDKKSADFKNHEMLMDIYDKDYLFSVVLHSFTLVANDVKTKRRFWYVYDHNDTEFRAQSEVCNELKILPFHLENISEIKPR